MLNNTHPAIRRSFTVEELDRLCNKVASRYNTDVGIRRWQRATMHHWHWGGLTFLYSTDVQEMIWSLEARDWVEADWCRDDDQIVYDRPLDRDLIREIYAAAAR